MAPAAGYDAAEYDAADVATRQRHIILRAMLIFARALRATRLLLRHAAMRAFASGALS